MKIKSLFFTLAVLFSFLPLSFAEDYRPIVRMVYFLPSDRTPQPDFDEKMDTVIKDVQAFFANQMEAHGFGRKTFVFETDARGKAVVHHFVGQFTEEYYDNASRTEGVVQTEIREQFDLSKDIYIIAIDTSLGQVIKSDVAAFCGLGGGDGSRGQAYVAAAEDCFSVRLVAHELGHVFGLYHGAYKDIDNTQILSYTRDSMLASFWAADWWDVLPAFNPPRPVAINNEHQHPTVTMLSPSLAAPPDVISLRFEITDPSESLHQAQLIENAPGLGGPNFLAGQRLNGEPSEVVEFVTSQLTLRDREVRLQMVDAHGNMTRSQWFPIDITPLLPPSEVFSTVRLNKGSASGVAYSADGQTLAVAGSLGVWLYDTKTDVQPVLIEIDGAVTNISFSPDRQTLAVAVWGQRVYLWDVRTREFIRTFELLTIPLDLSFSPDGRLLAVAGSDGSIDLWEVSIGERYDNPIGRAHAGNCNGVSFSPDGQTIASSGVDNAVRLWDVSTGELRREFIGHTHWVMAVSFSPDGQTIASGGLLDGIRLWDVRTGELRQTITTHFGSFHSLAFSPDGKTLASGGNRLELWDAESGELRHTLDGHTYTVLSIAFSPDGSTLASVSGQDSIVNTWDVMTGELRETLTGYSGNLESISFSPDSETLATVGDGKTTIDMWDVRTGELRHTLTGHTDPVNNVAFRPDGRMIASGASDNTVRLWDVRTGELHHTLTGHTNRVNNVVWPTNRVNNVVFSPDGKTLASADYNFDRSNTIRLWDVSTGELRHTLTGHTDRITKVAFRPDGKTLASVSFSDNTIRVWDVMTGTPLHVNSIAHTGGWTIASPNAKNTSFSPDGKTFACVDNTHTIHLWDVMTGELRQALSGHYDTVVEVSFSSDGKTLASASHDHTIGLWDVMTGELRHTLIGHGSWIDTVSFSPDGKTLASGSWDIRLWDAESGEFRHIITGHTYFINTVLFSPDGQTLASGAGGTVRLWQVTPIASEREKIKEDVNGDDEVNIRDLVAVAAALGETGENAADVNGDGIVDIRDLVAVAAAIGEVAAAPAALRQQGAAHLTQEEVQHWLTQAQQLNLTDARTQRGILFLEQLLAAFTPKETALLPNYPNPFNPETWIPYQLATPANVTLKIYDIQGRVVRDLDLGHQRPGIYQSKSRAAYWDGHNEVGERVASGVYFYTLTAGDFTATRKLLIRK